MPQEGAEISKSLPLNKITKVFSICDPKVLLAILYSPQDPDTRVDLADSSGILQVAVIPMNEQFKVPPHVHNSLERQTIGTSESGVVLNGSIKLDVFDVDNIQVGSWILRKGSIAITEKGGHGLTSLQSNTLVYEFKNGPYWGPDADKVRI